MKNEVRREDIHYNFLRNIVIRFDFDGVDAAELEDVLSDISDFMKKTNMIRELKSPLKKWI